MRDVDVSRDPAAEHDMVRRSGQSGVPVIDVGGRVLFAKYNGTKFKLEGIENLLFETADVWARLK